VSSAPSRALPRTATRCCASCATIAAPRLGRASGYEGLHVNPVHLDTASCPDIRLVSHAQEAWERAVSLGEIHGYRNAQASVIAPTGTIG